MSERTELFKKLRDSFRSRVAYTKAVVGVNVASQVKALRLRRGLTQADLANEAAMKQSRISVLERPGESVSINTLVELAAAFKVGVIVKFVPFSEMMHWKSIYRQDSFDATPIFEDAAFLEPKDAISAYDKFIEVTNISSQSGDPTWAPTNTDRSLSDSINSKFIHVWSADRGEEWSGSIPLQQAQQ